MDSTHRTLKFYLYLAAVVTLGIAISLLRPQPALSDSGLTALVNAAFIPRTEDPALHELAHQRALAASVNFSHVGATTAEVLAWNQGLADPVSTVVQQWLESPVHRAVLMDPTLTRIGCAGITTSDGRYVSACTLAAGSIQEPGPEGQPSNVGGSESTPLPAPTPLIPVIPNTSLRTP